MPGAAASRRRSERMRTGCGGWFDEIQLRDEKRGYYNPHARRKHRRGRCAGLAGLKLDSSERHDSPLKLFFGNGKILGPDARVRWRLQLGGGTGKLLRP